MRRLLVLAVVVVALLVLSGGAWAIVYGGPDGNGHPEVGGILAERAYSDGTWLNCSGSLIAPRIFLTAAHCDEGYSTDRVAITFDSSYDARSGTTYWGTWHVNPTYNQSQSDPQDIAVIVLDKPINKITPAQLPAANSLNMLSTTDVLTSVGYGVQLVTNDPGGKTYHYADVRYAATGTVNSLNPAWLRISMNPSTGNGGTCYGDSGGPNFLGAGSSETTIIAAITIGGDTACRSTNVDYRLDTQSARSFLGQYVKLP